MVRELIFNAALLISGLYIGSLILQRAPLASSARIPHLPYGCFFGALGTLLFVLSDTDAYYRFDSFHLVPIAICALRISPLAAIYATVSALLLGSGFIRDEELLHYSLETLALGFGSAWIAAVSKRAAAAWAGVSALAIAATLLVTAWGGGIAEYRTESVAFAVGLLIAMLGADSFVRSVQNRTALLTEYQYLTQHDLLTGLLNFQTFQARLKSLLTQGHRVCFILVDCDDVKSLNTEQGFHTVDGTLKNVANLLRAYFPDALLIGRCGSDEFAVVITMPDDLEAELEFVLEKQIPELADIRLAYGYAVFPDEESDPNLFVSLVQKRMLETKRRLWLEREAHWLHNERLMAVGELAAGMAHEIRNPLTTVKGFLQVAKQNGYDISEYYDIIMHEIKRMSDLTAEFLQFSKPAAHRPSLISIQECVQAAVQLTESEIIKNGHQLQIQADETPIYALLEKDKIVQVLVNLIRNGIDAMAEPGNGTLTIVVYPRGEFGMVDVTDTGTGIPESHLVRLFQPFFSTKAKGTGLGLSISQKIIGEHGGYISVRSKVGVGTTFTIRLPTAEREPAWDGGRELHVEDDRRQVERRDV